MCFRYPLKLNIFTAKKAFVHIYLILLTSYSTKNENNRLKKVRPEPDSGDPLTSVSASPTQPYLPDILRMFN